MMLLPPSQESIDAAHIRRPNLSSKHVQNLDCSDELCYPKFSGGRTEALYKRVWLVRIEKVQCIVLTTYVLSFLDVGSCRVNNESSIRSLH